MLYNGSCCPNLGKAFVLDRISRPQAFLHCLSILILLMSLLESTFASSSSLQIAGPRKRTSSFSIPNASFSPSPRPSKAPRINVGSLHRTESFLTMPALQNEQSASSSSQPSPQQPDRSSVPYYRTLRFYKEQRERRKALLNRHIPPITIRTRLQVTHSESNVQCHVPQSISTPSHPIPIATPQCRLPKPGSSQLRSSSPLAPTRTLLPGRPVFPRSKPEPDLYRKAITTRMRCTPEGQKILHMGPRLAVSIMTATRELERIVGAQTQRDQPSDVTMGDATPLLSNSWVVVPGEDWEMVDCGA